MSRVPEVLMCRLFGLHGGAQPVAATFWLLEAPDSLSVQSRRDPDGTGLGWYDDGQARVERSPIAAYEDRRFAEEARHVTSRTFVAHVHFASTGGLRVENTHPFEQDGRLLAHNGVVGNLPQLDARLTELGTRGLVQGDTDSERVFALVTGETRRTGGDLAAGLTAAVHWVAAALPLYALNLVIVSRDQLWALRYLDTHDLLVLARSAGGPAGGRHLDAACALGSIRVRSGDLAATPAVLVASERLDEDPGWHPLNTGKLLHVGPDLQPRIATLLDTPPVHPLTLAELGEQAARSQQPTLVSPWRSCQEQPMDVVDRDTGCGTLVPKSRPVYRDIRPRPVSTRLTRPRVSRATARITRDKMGQASQDFSSG